MAQVTDLHLAYRYFLKEWHLRRLRRVMRSIGPDVAVNTGDLFCQRKRFSPIPAIDQYMRFVGSEWPWAFTWGNHDLDALPEYLPDVEDYLDACPRILYARSRDFFVSRAGAAVEREAFDDSNLSGNYAIEIYDGNEEPRAGERPAWIVFFLNSGTREHVSPIVLDWGREVCARYGFKTPAVCFMHRPVREAGQRAKSGDIAGFAHESVCSDSDEGRVHTGFRAMRSVKACFFGHDHSNNFSCEVDGIVYHAARKSLSLSYGALSGENVVRRKNKNRPAVDWGVTAITLAMDDGTIGVRTVLENGDAGLSYDIR